MEHLFDHAADYREEFIPVRLESHVGKMLYMRFEISEDRVVYFRTQDPDVYKTQFILAIQEGLNPIQVKCSHEDNKGWKPDQVGGEFLVGKMHTFHINVDYCPSCANQEKK